MIFSCPYLVQGNAGASSPLPLLAELRSELSSASSVPLRNHFLLPSNADYLFQMADNRGGLKRLKVAIIPAPPGWEKGYWAIFHTTQTIEEDHDPVYHLVDDPSRGWMLGSEIPEDQTGGSLIASQDYQAHLEPGSSKVSVDVRVRLKSASTRAIPFRLNDLYGLNGDNLIADDQSIPNPKLHQIVRAGSLLIRWEPGSSAEQRFSYSGVLSKSQEDEITNDDAYVTAWWLPSLGRLPFRVKAEIRGPIDWKIRGEGFEGPRTTIGSEQICRFDCNLPISYPKIIAGKYTLMASKTVQGDRFAIWQVSPVDKGRAESDLASTIEAAKFYRKLLGRLPFRGYECYDATRFYGIESYSHTLLRRDVTHFISHEMGHTYFGGMAPCAYVHDSWNEGITQYVDSVALQNDSDHSLESGLRTVGIPVPLSEMAIPWNLGDATYWRGCYVLKMLEAEIGKPKVELALKRIAAGRVGKDTRWKDLRTYFEEVSGEDLTWFWDQWVNGSTFPKISIFSHLVGNGGGTWETELTVSQSGTVHPYRMKVLIRLHEGKRVKDTLVDLNSASKALRVKSDWKPEGAETVLFPFTLASVAK